MSSEALLEAADQALYFAKQQGRNRFALAGVLVQSPAPSPHTPEQPACR